MHFKRYILLLIFIILRTPILGGDVFKNISFEEFDKFTNYIIAIGDINSDNLPDVFISGRLSQKDGCSYKAELLVNNGENFALLSSNFIPLTDGRALFVDIDNNGTNDLVYIGKDEENQPQLLIYQNDGTSFVKNSQLTIEGLSFSYIECIDYNQNGLVDFIISGLNSNGTFESKLIVNNGNMFFKEQSSDLPDLINPIIQKLDYNLDGYQDVIIAGKDISNKNVISLFENQEGLFKENTKIRLPDFRVISMKIYDTDNDGDEDIIISGYDSLNTPITGIIFNKPTGYIGQNINVIDSIAGDLVINDFDFNGKVDIVVSGFDTNFKIKTKLLFQYELNKFTGQLLNIKLYNTKIYSNFFDNDTKPDIFIYGLDSLNTPQCFILKNIVDTDNLPPQLPTSIKVNKLAYNYIIFENSFASDDISDTLSLKYQYRLGTLENADHFISKENIFLSQGLLTQRFNVTLLPGKYIFQLRVVDNTGLVSQWSETDTIIVNEFTHSGINFKGLYGGKIGIIDFNKDGFTDIYYNGFDSHNEANFLLYLNKNGTYSNKPDISMEGTGFGNAFMYDVNKDGGYDLIITGSSVFDRLSEDGSTKIFYNEQDSLVEKSIEVLYKDSTVSHLPSLMESYVKIVDINNDTKPEILLMGTNRINSNNFEPKFFIFTCENDNKFTNWDSTGIDGFRYGSFDIGDLNNDGLPDIVIIGLSWGLSNQLIPKTSIYIQKANNKFEELKTANLKGLEINSNVKLFDINGDNSLDIVIQGGESVSNAKLIGYLNAFPNFTECFSLSGSFVGDIDIVDIDHDNNIEIISTGWSPLLNRSPSIIYTYDGISLNKLDKLVLDSLYWSSVKFFDFDNDSHNDILITGINSNDIPITSLYRNSIFPDTFQAGEPILPSNIEVVSIKDTAILSWNSNQNTFYNVQIYNSLDNCLFENSYFLPNNKIIVRNLDDGNYTAKIYSYDKGLKKSQNYKEKKFNIDTTPPEITDCIIKSIIGIGEVVCNLQIYDPSGLDTTFIPNIFLVGNDTIEFSIENFYSNLIIAKASINPLITTGNYKLYINKVKDKKGNQLVEPVEVKSVYVDTEQPALISSYPGDGEQFVSTYSTLKFYFSRVINDESININNIYLSDAQKNKIAGQFYVSYLVDTTLCLFQPHDRLENDKLYTIYLGTNIKDTLGNPLDKEYIITFKTAGLVKPDLGATIISADSVASLYIPPFSIDKEEEISFTNIENLLGNEDYIIRLLPEVKFLSPVNLFLNLGKINNFDISKERTLAIFDSLTSSYIPLQTTKDEEYINVPINKTGIYALLNKKIDEKITSVVDKVVNISPRVFFPDKEILNISFFANENSKVTIKIFDISGRLNAIILDEKEYSKGNYTVSWNGKSNDGDKLKGGLYILFVKIENKVYKKTFVIKY